MHSVALGGGVGGVIHVGEYKSAKIIKTLSEFRICLRLPSTHLNRKLWMFGAQERCHLLFSCIMGNAGTR